MGGELRQRYYISGGSSSVSSSTKNSSSPEAVTKCHDVDPKGIHKFWRLLSYIIMFIFGLAVLRKTQNAIHSVWYVKTHGHSVSEEAIAQSPQFQHLLRTFDTQFSKPPAIFLLNQYALNMTFNFLCNTHDLEGVHDRVLFVTLDSVARDVLRQYWPKIQQIYWPTPCLYQPFSFAEGAYQTLYLLRANLAVNLLKNGKSFWMMQQDTFWRRNLFDLNLEDDYEYDAIFDQIGYDADSKRAEWVNGANFFVRANNDTLRFFEAIARKIGHWYTPDMAVMIHQCHTWDKPKCAYMPHKIANSWEWLHTDQQNPPYVMQLDCETDGGSKLMQLAKYGFYFMNKDDNRVCNQTAVDEVRQKMDEGEIRPAKPGILGLSWGRLQFRVYWWIVDYMLSTPIIGHLIKPYLPLVGFIIMITI